jgi:RecB family exonuclease
MLDTVIGMGSTAEGCREEAGLWHAVDHPGQLVDLTKELVWWGFNDPETASPTYWSDQERAALEKAGVALEASHSLRSREAFAWQNGLQKATRRLIGLYIARLDGEEAYHHPLWDTIMNAASRANESASEDAVHACLVKACSDFDHQENWTFAGRKQTLNKVPKRLDTPITPKHSVPPSVIKTPDRLSYSQMSTLIGCPLKWALDYFAGLKLPESQVIPTGNQMIGSLCHRIIQELYDNGRPWDAEAAGIQAGILFDRLLPAMASELLLEGNTVEKQRYRGSICAAVRLLTEAINRRHLKVEKTEVPLSATVEGIPFIGFADLLLRDAAGHAYVLDLKWSSSSKYRRQEIEEGTALQLATYAWMLRSAEQAEQIHTGYFMLAQGQLISDSPLLSDEVINAPCSLEEVWNRGVGSLKSACNQLADGLLEARGVKELLLARENDLDEEKIREKITAEYQASGLLYQRPPCNFCDFGYLCGRSGGVR